MTQEQAKEIQSQESNLKLIPPATVFVAGLALCLLKPNRRPIAGVVLIAGVVIYKLGQRRINSLKEKYRLIPSSI